MAGKAYTLPRPKPDVQPDGFGAESTGYETGFRPAARYAHAGSVGAWELPQESVTHMAHCNKMFRVSMAGMLPPKDARAAGTYWAVAGRPPAPRFEVGCLASPAELPVLPGAFARDLLGRRPAGTDPGGGDDPWVSGPPPGLPPPPVGPGGPIVPATPPSLPPLNPGVPGVPVMPVPPGDPVPITPYTGPPLGIGTGYLLPVNFHLTADSGGAQPTEVRMYGPISRPFYIREILVNAPSGVTDGQFFDVLVSDDRETSDDAVPDGTSIFQQVTFDPLTPGADQDRGMAVPFEPVRLPMSFRCDQGDRVIKVVSRFQAPAIALPNLHVTVVVELQAESVVPGYPIEPRPPVDSPPLVPPVDSPPPLIPPSLEPPLIIPEVPGALPPGSVPGSPVPTWVPPVRPVITAEQEAMRLASQMPAGMINRDGVWIGTGQTGLAYWTANPDSPEATWFRELVVRLEGMGFP